MKLGVKGLMETFRYPIGYLWAQGGGAKMANLEAKKHIKWERMETRPSRPMMRPNGIEKA